MIETLNTAQPSFIESIFPNINNGFGNVGFLLGSGASKEAGYPLTSDLTISVINRLTDTERTLLKSLLDKDGVTSDFAQGIPDIEVVSDSIYKHKLAATFPQVANLDLSFREKIVEELMGVVNPNLEAHIKFLRAIKNLLANRSECVWIFTTNYDLLIELAAMHARIPIHNGFEGVLLRYFDIERMDLKFGNIEKKKFSEYKEPCIKLVKLHGSISWFKDGDVLFESSEHKHLKSSPIRSMILPRKQKVMDALEHPYDKLFKYASQIIGGRCKYLVSCGYSFRDQHINEQLIMPKLRQGKIRLTALLKQELENTQQFQTHQSFNFITEDKSRFDNKIENGPSTIWKFSEFVNQLAARAGLGGNS